MTSVEAPAAPILSGRHLSKRYGRLFALRDVDIDVYAGEIVGLVGDNGAGKSTLVGILAGAIPATAGAILVKGKPVTFSGPQDAKRQGIEIVYQDLALALDVSVTDNIFLGRELRRGGLPGRIGWLDQKGMNRQASELLNRIGISTPNPGRACMTLSGGQRQAVAVARAVAWGSSVVLMDEPTAALGVEERSNVNRSIVALREHGTPVILITHNLPQVMALADRIVVLRHGRVVAELRTSETNLEEVVSFIVGGEGSSTTRDLAEQPVSLA
jgi:simple sugar transport system ATP-binding protein